MSGERKHGFGIDTMRAWVVSKDSDRSMQLQIEDIEKVNSEVKLIRGLLRVMLNNVQEYNGTKIAFNQLTFIDKLMMRRVLLFSIKLSEAYESFNLNEVYSCV